MFCSFRRLGGRWISGWTSMASLRSEPRSQPHRGLPLSEELDMGGSNRRIPPSQLDLFSPPPLWGFPSTSPSVNGPSKRPSLSPNLPNIVCILRPASSRSAFVPPPNFKPSVGLPVEEV